MRVYKHQSGHKVAVTEDSAGASLPAGDWSSIGQTDIEPDQPYIGKSGNEIIADITERGYSIIPDDK